MLEQAKLQDSLVDEVDTSEFLNDVVEGLSCSPKTLPCKYFYNERGSVLFGKICETPEYYITRTETALLRQIAPEISEMLGPDCNLLELGSGLGEKIRILLDALDTPQSYTPMDISEEVLFNSAAALQPEYPNLRIRPWVGDYTRDLDFKLKRLADFPKPVVFFPGSTISNFNPEDAQVFLTRIRRWLGEGGVLLIGVDTEKPAELINAAYNDNDGYTAAFNMNLLHRIKDELDVDLSPENFRHHAFFNADESRLEMHLVSEQAQRIDLHGVTVDFAEGETIHTENSYKYRVSDFHKLAQSVGFTPQKTWQDTEKLFSFHYLTADA